MPNWCWNNLTIEGDKESISKFRKILNTPDKTELLCKSEDKESLRKEYLNMIKKRYISSLLNFNDKQILGGINEIKLNYKKELKFKDRLICLILNK